MLKLAYEYLADSYSLLENPIQNYIIMAIVGLLAYHIAYRIVGWFYCTDIIWGRQAGHILHWIIRFFVFVIIYYAAATAVRIYKWIIGIPLYVWWIIITSIAIITVSGILVQLILHRKRATIDTLPVDD